MSPRLELPHDHDAVDALVRSAFGDHGDTVAALVVDLRRDDPGFQALVAEESGEVVGHVMFTRSLLDAPRELLPVQVLSPLAVAPKWQRRGIGSELVRAGLELMDKRGEPLVFLEGDP